MEKKTAKKRKFWTPKSPKNNEDEPVRDMLRGISISNTQSCDETALIIIEICDIALCLPSCACNFS